MSDPREELRRLIDSAEPVTEAEARARADAGRDETEVLTAPAVARAQRPLLLAAAAAVLVVLVAGLLAWDQSDDARVTTGSMVSTTVTPPATVLEPTGHDPLVSCDDFDLFHFFPLSALSSPTGAEMVEDPPTEALRESAAVQQDLGTVPSGPWRRIVDTEDRVLYMVGDLDPADLDGSSPVGFVEIVRLDGRWSEGSSMFGPCNRLVLHPGEGNVVAHWRLDPDSLPVDVSAATALRLEVRGNLLWCPGVLRQAELVGPDVIESEQSVTIRVAFADPPIDPFDCEGESVEESPIEVTVPLNAPLGDRQVLDGNVYPARVVDRQLAPPR